MKTVLRLLVLGFIINVIGACSQLPAPTDADIDLLTKNLKEINDQYGASLRLDESIREEYEKKLNESIDTAFSRWDIMQASLDQIEKIAQSGNLYRNQHLRSLVYPRLVELSGAPSLEGAKAKGMSIVNFPMDPAKPGKENQLEWAKAYIQFTEHPAIPELMKQEGRGG